MKSIFVNSQWQGGSPDGGNPRNWQRTIGAQQQAVGIKRRGRAGRGVVPAPVQSPYDEVAIVEGFKESFDGMPPNDFAQAPSLFRPNQGCECFSQLASVLDNALSRPFVIQLLTTPVLWGGHSLTSLVSHQFRHPTTEQPRSPSTDKATAREPAPSQRRGRP